MKTKRKSLTGICLRHCQLMLSLDLRRLDWIYADLIDLKTVRGENHSLLRSCFFISEPKSFEITNPRLYMISQSLRNLQFDHCTFFSHFVHIYSTHTSAEQTLCASVGNLQLVLLLGKPLTSSYNNKDAERWLVQDRWSFYSLEVLVNSVEGFSMHLHTIWDIHI